MEEKKNLTLEELEQEKKSLEQENEYLKMRKMDVALYQKAYEKYVVNDVYKSRLTYDRLLDHPDYYTKWRDTFFDSQIKLIESGIFVRRPGEPANKTLAERRHAATKTYNTLSSDTITEVANITLWSPVEYDRLNSGICKFSELTINENNPYKKATYLDIDQPWAILGYCDSVKTSNDKYQLHLIDPLGECLFAPFDISPEEAELALGRICVVYCAYNHYAAEPKLLELQILPFTLSEKLGNYETDTIVIEKNPKINYHPLAFLG